MEHADLYAEQMRLLRMLVRASPHQGQPDERYRWRGMIVQPQCGDRISFALILSSGMVQSVLFEAHGCLLSSAAAALVAAHVHEKPVPYCMMTDDALVALIGLPIGINRRLCVTMALDALRSALAAREQ